MSFAEVCKVAEHDHPTDKQMRFFGCAMAPKLTSAVRYLRGWFFWARYLWMARRKKHGAGKQRWAHAFKGAACARYLIDGQFRNAPPWWFAQATRRARSDKTVTVLPLQRTQ